MSNKSANRRIKIWINDKEVVNSFAGIQKQLRKSNNELRNMTRGTKEYNNKVKEVQGLNKHLASHRQSIAGVNRSWLNLKTIMAGVIGAQVITGVFEKITQFIPNLIKRNAELSDSFADVRKTTGLSEEGIKDLNKELSLLDTRTPRKKLLELARDAGKLGVTGVKNIAAFVNTANKIEVSLGEDLGQGAIKNIGKLNDVFGETEKLGLAPSMEATGSAINALGQASTASEEFIVSMTQRLAGMAAQADISIENTLGLASATDQLGLKSEMSATAIGKTLIEMYKDTAAFAQIAGKSEEEFAKQLEEDANGAFISFLEGLNGNSEGLGTMAVKLEEVGVNGARGTQVLASLATRTDILKEAQALSNKEYAKATSLTEEYNVKNNNLAGTIDKISKKFNKMFANSTLKTGLESVFGAIGDYMTVPLSQKLEKEQSKMNLLGLKTISAAEGTKQRADYIAELQTNYPGFFENLDLEKSKNEDIAAALKEANGHYLAKIGIQVEEERMATIMKDVNQLKRDAMDAEEEFMVAVTNMATAQGFEMGENTALEAYQQMRDKLQGEIDADDANVEVAGSAQFLNRTADQRNAVDDLDQSLNNMNKSSSQAAAAQKQLDDQIEQSTKIIEQYDSQLVKIEKKNEKKDKKKVTGSGGDNKKPVDPTEQAKILKTLQAQIQRFQREADLMALDGVEKQKEQVRQKYADAIALATEGSEEMLILTQLQEDEMAIIEEDARIAREDAEKEAMERLANLSADETDRKILALEEEKERITELIDEDYADKLISEEEYQAAKAEIAAKYTKDVLKIVNKATEKEFDWKLTNAQRFSNWRKANAKRAAKDKKDWNQEDYEADEQLYQDKAYLASSFAGFLGAVNQFIGKSGEELTDFQKALALAEIAINTAVGISNVIRDASSAGNPLLMAAYIAAGLGMLFAGMAQAKQVLAPVESPEMKEQKVPAYAKGTDYHPGGMAWVGEEGPELVNLPKGAQVHTAAQSKEIANQRMNVDAALSAYNNEDSTEGEELEGTPTFGESGSTSSMNQMILEIKRVGDKLDSYERQKQFVLSNKKFEKDQGRIQLRKTMRNIG